MPEELKASDFEPATRPPSPLATALYALTIVGVWALTAPLTIIAVGIWLTHYRWKPGVLALFGLGITLWLSIGVWDLIRETRAARGRRLLRR